MPGTTPNYAFPYQLLTDSPNGAGLGQSGFTAVDTALAAEAVARANADTAESAARTGYHQLVGRMTRTANTTGITTIARVLMVSGPVTAGRSYKVTCHSEMFSNGGPATSQNELRYTTNGVDPAVTDTVLDRTLINHASSGSIPDLLYIEGLFDAGATGTLKVTLCVTRVVGAVTVDIAAGPTFPLKLEIFDLGPTIANTGTSY